MQPRTTQKITIYNNVTPVAVSASTDTTPIVVTATAHGFKTGQRVLIFGHTANIAANGIFKVTVLSANTFSLQDEFTGFDVVGSGVGAGAGGICLIAPPIINLESFRNAVLQFGTSGTATTTVKAYGSMGAPESPANFGPGAPRKDMPNFGGTITPSNPYSTIQMIPLDTGTPVNGGTGIVVAGTDVNNMWEVNTNAIRFFILIPVSWTQGAINAVLFNTDNL
jgi:hypothetical protein